MPESKYPDLQHIAGYVGKPPVMRTYDGKDFLSFTVGVSRNYSDGDDRTAWYSVSVSKPELAKTLQGILRKGTPVVLEGTIKQKNDFLNFYAFRVGVVEWVVASKAKQRDEVDEDL